MPSGPCIRHITSIQIKTMEIKTMEIETMEIETMEQAAATSRLHALRRRRDFLGSRYAIIIEGMKAAA